MDVLYPILIFAGEALIVVLALAALIILIAVVVGRSSRETSMTLERLDRRFKRHKWQLKSEILPAKELKKGFKEDTKEPKKPVVKSTTFVVDFNGDVKASPAEDLGHEVNAILQAAQKGDEIIVRLESPGGVVHGYGLAAAQLARLKAAGYKVTVCVDKVAASGGYLMACTADQIIAAPFAIVGSIGVVAQVPNVHRALKKWDVDYKEYTAGEFKRTVSFLGEITPKGEAKFQEQLEDTHKLFKNFVQSHRPKLDLDTVATGEYWYGEQALGLGLVDAISTSDDQVMKHAQDRNVLLVKYEEKKSFPEKLSGFMGNMLHKVALRLIQDLDRGRYL